jgi:hypothetical protein
MGCKQVARHFVLRIGCFFISSIIKQAWILANKKAQLPSAIVLNHQVIPFGFEPKTYCLEGSCSIQLSYGTQTRKKRKGQISLACSVGVARFELTTSCSQSRRDTGLRYTPKKSPSLPKWVRKSTFFFIARTN